ncbi:MAG: hypothetical protein A2745_02330 [Candidatus Harrisonbacteria bacterium RIFCSPHIGHO2_01_FULL_44_13]|uniref:Uncharacterized protein n=1 Tax=Candidatus Harrisonbacteria bacterium RIFCSPLOWO2_01_FULL_44_18 TaxID=1798407 RepID=A0A1G1ZM06_9BACT|nr:MAG: hypothetical protein A2745_02330 [Candidatus Harrisonbacteria bacterium RIFCSPHIGHO2_01_FULL_44_13]OGY65555.1 MAG: hypothetical protein A3A16_01690 [Candidatus Harrisonbacteria bacterium RIFCSPLOWO2_01_FULL_44_18]
MKERDGKSPGYLTWDILKQILEEHGGQIQGEKLYFILARRGYLVWGADLRDILGIFQGATHEENLITYVKDKDLVVLNKS